MSWSVECVECGKKEKFGDAKDVSYAKWRILAWVVPSGEPRVVCPDCEYGQPKKKKDK